MGNANEICSNDKEKINFNNPINLNERMNDNNENPTQNKQLTDQSKLSNNIHHNPSTTFNNQTSCISIQDFTISPSETINTKFLSLNDINQSNVQDYFLNKIKHYFEDKYEELISIISNDKYLKLLQKNEPYKLVNQVIKHKDLINQNKKGVSITMLLILADQTHLVDQMIINNCDLFACDQLMHQNVLWLLIENKILDINLFDRIKNYEFLSNFTLFFNYKNQIGQTQLFPVCRSDNFLFVLKHLVQNSKQYSKQIFERYLLEQDNQGQNCIHQIIISDSVEILKFIEQSTSIHYLSYSLTSNNDLNLDIFSIIILQKARKILRQIGDNNRLNIVNKHHRILSSSISQQHLILEYYDDEIFTRFISILFETKNDISNLSFITKSGKTPVFFAATYGNIRFINYVFSLIEESEDSDGIKQSYIETSDQRGFTPLHSAVQHGRYEFCQTLLTLGAEVNRKAHENLTPLHLAVISKNQNIVRMLMKHGADPLLKNGIGESSFKLALGDDELLACLCNVK